MTSDLSNTLYASRRKELLALINQLRAVGAQSDLDLPRITVIGNQSAGKSSVVEAISGITVPRDAGTCTRCPMECRLLSSTGPWTCQISIRQEFDRGGNRLREVFETRFGGTITDKSQVELALRRAQFSVLNPGIPQKDILNASPEKLKTMATQKSMPFSKNVVCVDLEGPELTDLSFIDLPGLIQNAEPNVVQLVEDMVVSHIGGNSLILIALPMTDDIENQKALLLAKKVDKEGRRTIGVLTKPDMLGTGSTKAASLWLDVLEDRRHPLMHGYYCTRQPNDDERCAGIDADEARATEEKFFKTTTPWSKSTSPLRFGIKNLISSLSRLLVQIIDDNLPKIREDTSKQLSDCRRTLEQIPPPISEEPATYLLSLVTTFCSEFQTLVRGRADSAELIRLHRETYATFKTAIRKTAPNFVPCVANEKVTDFNNCLPDEEDDVAANVSVAVKPSMNLTDVKKHIDQSITRELPNNVPYEAKASLIIRFQATWPKAVDECFPRVEDVTLKLLFKMVEERFGRYALLQSHIRNFIKMLMDEHKSKCKEILEAALDAERMPYTQNDHYLETTTQAWLNKYKAVRSGYVDDKALDPNTQKHKVIESPPRNLSSGASAPVGQEFSFSQAPTTRPANPFGAAASAGIPPRSAFAQAFTSKAQTAPGAKSAAPQFSSFFNPQTSPPIPGAKPTAPTAFSFGKPLAPPQVHSEKPMPASMPITPPNRETVSSNGASTDEDTHKALQEAIGLLVQAGLPVSSLNPTELLGN
ncbi:P-loop containing nucleoside triphosphate hydrolase protein [Gymnopus androsaceus JB14]|uniref:P-loop containing nucleoside triphosphate hydrolase protein n=1 Tax=Gymnopus androsaceus JB14 TaxID=1447944 RepID=A0A6A4HG07_9AGAR|nr:P-loop containing nucleoside triphosphate hydrolase protein [Gymnopus androsaceus JB14]